MSRNPASLFVRRAFTLVEMLVAIGIIVILAVITVSATVALVERSEISATENVLKLLDTAIVEWEAQSDRKITWGPEGLPYARSSYDMYDGVPHVFTVSELIYTIGRSEAVKPILAQIKPEFIHRYDTSGQAPGWIRLPSVNDPDPNAGNASGTFGDGDLGPDSAPRPITGMLAVLDPWGIPIRAVHPGRPRDSVLFAADGSASVDDDGTIRLESPGSYAVEEIYGAARDRRIIFVSAGPDGEFGDLSADPDGTPAEREQHERAHDNVVSYSIEDDH